LVWIRMPHLPLHFWSEECFRAMGNVVGKFLVVDPWTESYDNTTFARILVDMDMNVDFLAALELKVLDSTWTQSLDFEGLPFRCRTCFSLGHLAADCHIIKKSIKRRVSWWKDFNPDNLVVEAHVDNNAIADVDKVEEKVGILDGMVEVDGMVELLVPSLL
ncbi:hypothetical protein KI387_033961, partial [Taxus chinensis]